MTSLKNKILDAVLGLAARISLGKELAAAVAVLRLVVRAIDKNDPQEISTYVFKKLPAHWKAPEGPATEKEFVAMIEAGEAFIRRALALNSK